MPRRNPASLNVGVQHSGHQYQFPEQVGLRTSEQLHLAGLDLVDGALYRAGVVWQVSPAVTAWMSRCSPTVNERSAGQVVIDGGHPPGQLVLVAGQVLDHAGEAGHTLYGGVDLGTSGPDRL